MKQVDAVVIGFGTAGKALALALAESGMHVCVIEQSERMYGGTCPNVACIPTKELVHASELARMVGGDPEKRQERYAAAIDDKDRLVRWMRVNNYHGLADHPHVSVVDGTASFVTSNLLHIEGDAESEDVEADMVFIATGSRPVMPDIPGIAGPRVYTSETMIDVRVLPERLVIVGAGYIGMEFASLYCNFGSQVAVVQDSREFLPREDRDIAQAVRDSLEGRGIRLELGVQVVSIEDDGMQSVVVAQRGGETLRLPADAVLVATGRRPNLDGLNIQAAGVDLTRSGGVETDDHLRATVPNVWALGDARGKQQFTYIAYDDYRIVASDLIGDGSRTTHSRGAVPYAIFTTPPFARVGMTEQEAREAGHNVKTALLPGKNVIRARILDEPDGLLKAVVDADSEQILGMHLFCVESPELANLAKLAMDAQVPYPVMRDAIYTHPTMAESFNNLFSAIDAS